MNDFFKYLFDNNTYNSICRIIDNQKNIYQNSELLLIFKNFNVFINKVFKILNLDSNMIVAVKIDISEFNVYLDIIFYKTNDEYLSLILCFFDSNTSSIIRFTKQFIHVCNKTNINLIDNYIKNVLRIEKIKKISL